MNVFLEWPIKDEDDIAIINKAKECIQNGIESFEYDISTDAFTFIIFK